MISQKRPANLRGLALSNSNERLSVNVSVNNL